MPTRKRVAGYTRVSSGKDAMLHSLSAQVSCYSQLIQSRSDWEFAGIYADQAETGTKDSRAEFQRMLTDCRAGKIDLVITNAVITKGQFYKGSKRLCNGRFEPLYFECIAN
jgi:DNA invertase Pin-like site-specific DNA recombinase